MLFDFVAKVPYQLLSKVALPTHLLDEYIIIYIKMRLTVLSSVESIYQGTSIKNVT